MLLLKKFEKVGSIEQFENRLIFGNIQGKNVNFCKLQKYASLITADCVVQEVEHNRLTDGNAKDPLVRQHNGVGYMPGETYSFGIIYIFDDGTLSPVYHIPGKNPTAGGVVYERIGGEDIYPMSPSHPVTETTYTSRESCGGNNDYWG